MKKHEVNLVPTILSGGLGSRLWPISRQLHPKPFIKLKDGQSLLQKTFSRAVSLPCVREILTVTHRELFFQSRDSYRKLNHNIYTSFLLEPFGRNTAPAIVAASLLMAKKYGRDITLLTLPADHIIKDQKAFKEAVKKATTLAQEEKLVTFGILPSSPQTGYGYMEVDGHTVLRFVEKPTEKTAKEYKDSGRFLWNSGLFCFRADTLLKEMKNHCPEIVFTVKKCLESSTICNNPELIELDPSSFQNVKDISIDYAVMEKSNQVAVVPCDMGWSDIGSWLEMGQLVPPDENNNHIQGDILLEDVNNCMIQSDHRLIAGLGIHHLIVIDSPDALLIVHKDRAQDVKKIFQQLKKQGHRTYRQHV